MKKLLTIILIATALNSCGKFSLYTSDKGEQLAAVGKITLHEKDLQGIFAPTMTQADSAATREMFITQWIAQQVKSQAAETDATQQQGEIEDRVSQYRASLLTHRFEENYLINTLDTNVTDKHIREYYDANLESFRLAGPLVKARVARIPAGLRQSDKLKKMFQSKETQDFDDFTNICNKNNYRVVDLTGQWTDFSEVLQNIPFSNPNFDNFLRSKTFYEVEDDQYQYMMAIIDNMLTGETSPLEKEKNTIKKILLHNRRTDILKRLDDSLLKAAKREGLIQINK